MIGEMGSTPSDKTNLARGSTEHEAGSVLRWATASLFLGWGLIYFYWDVPFRALLWNEPFLKPAVETVFQTTWNDYVTSSAANQAIDTMMDAIGVCLLALAAVAAALPRAFERTAKLLLVGCGIMIVTMLSLWMESGFQAAMFLEHAGQMIAPVVFYLAVFRGRTDDALFMLMKIGVALTFTCHGLYALGVYPVPGPFIDMVISTTGVSEATARTLLKAAGVADLILSVAIFVPALRTPALAYAVMWGMLTTLARPLANADLGAGFEGFFYWIAQALYRAPHFALPLALLILYKGRAQESAEATPAPLERATLN